MWKKLSDQNQEVKFGQEKKERKNVKSKREENTMKKTRRKPTRELNGNGKWKKKWRNYLPKEQLHIFIKYDHYTLYAVGYIAKSLNILQYWNHNHKFLKKPHRQYNQWDICREDILPGIVSWCHCRNGAQYSSSYLPVVNGFFDVLYHLF